MKKTLVVLLKIILTGVVVYYVARQVWVNWDQVRQFDWQFDIVYLALSLVCAMAALVVFSAAWVKVISAFGHLVSQAAGYRILNLSNLGRYIPGKVWQVFGMLYLAKQKNIPEEQAAASFVITELFTIPASLLVWVIAAQFEPALLIDKFKIMGPGSAYTAGILGLLGCAVLVLYPQPFLRLANFVLRKLGRPPALFTLDKSVALQAFVGYFLGWILFGLAFWLFLVSILGDSAPSILLSIGLYNIAYQIGYLAIFAPSGLGPRELIMGALLAPFVGPVAPALAVVARIWSVVIDASAALLALAIRK
ncbi:MAG: lysylphosphatidylglycerol synthase transmembrane domain-containing protein [Candidatus Zixiibacteriota bacterium]